jgi:hypothetical protein
LLILIKYIMKNYTDRFDEAEYSNRPAAVKVLKKLCKYHPQFEGWSLKETRIEDKVRYDFWLEKDGKKILIEHKARNYEKRRFSDWQLNGNKYDNLRSLIKDDVVGVFYINTFLDGCAIWNLKKDIGERRWSMHNLKTVVESDLVVEYDMFFKLEDALYIE